MKTTADISLQERLAMERTILEKTGYSIRSLGLLRQIFTRSSYTEEFGGENNEILEFIGDQVLSYYVVKAIAGRCEAWSRGQYRFRLRENRFTAARRELVCNEALARHIDEWGLAQYLIVGSSDLHNQVDQQTKVKADLFEAILGGIAVASSWDAAVLEEAVCRMLDLDERLAAMIGEDRRFVPFDLENAVTVLKEQAEHGFCSVPKYNFAGPEDLGRDKNGEPIWCCTCSMVNEETGISRQVWGNSKKIVKKYAAYLVLCEHFQSQNEYGTNDFRGSWRYRDGRLMPATGWDDIQ